MLHDAIERMKPDGKQNLSRPEWLLYNILQMRFIQGRKVREIADRLAMSESDLFRKQRVAIGQVARVLSEMEQDKGPDRTLRSAEAHPAQTEPTDCGSDDKANGLHDTRQTTEAQTAPVLESHVPNS